MDFKPKHVQVAEGRFADWLIELEDWGWIQPGSVVQGNRQGPGEFVLHVRRPVAYGAPEVTLTVHERWVPGADPLGLTGEWNFHAEVLKWHAQFPGVGDPERRAERFDVDRRKPPELVVHTHPLGEPRGTRVASPMHVMQGWLDLIMEHIDDHAP